MEKNQTKSAYLIIYYYYFLFIPDTYGLHTAMPTYLHTKHTIAHRIQIVQIDQISIKFMYEFATVNNVNIIFILNFSLAIPVAIIWLIILFV